MSRVLIFMIVIGGLATVSAQSVVLRKGDGEMGAFRVVGSGGVQSLVFKLSDDENWTSAKSKLLEKASGDAQIEVVYYLEKFKSARAKDEEFVTRVDSVIAALAESGLHPLSSELIGTEVKALTSKLESIAKAETEGEITNEVLLSLVKARAQIDRANTMIETGEVPASPGPSGRVIRGGVRRGASAQD